MTKLSKSNSMIAKKRINNLLKTARLLLKSHGGGVKIKSIEGNKVELEVLGVCRGCPAVDETFGRVISGMIKKEIPEAEIEYN